MYVTSILIRRTKKTGILMPRCWRGSKKPCSEMFIKAQEVNMKTVTEQMIEKLTRKSAQNQIIVRNFQYVQYLIKFLVSYENMGS